MTDIRRSQIDEAKEMTPPSGGVYTFKEEIIRITSPTKQLETKIKITRWEAWKSI